MSSVVTAALAIGAVVVVALLARSGARRDDAPRSLDDSPRGDSEAEGDEESSAEVVDDDEDDDEGNVEVVAVTSDGYALVPDVHAVRLVPPHEEGDAWKAGDRGRNLRGELALSMSWSHADFTGARVVRGAADEGPWRFEAMGRDGEYTAFVFETREGADAALQLFLSRGIVRVGEDEDGNPATPSAEQFEEARRIYLETEAALESGDDPAE